MRILLTAALLLGASQVAAQPYAYVANANSDDVSVIDDATGTRGSTGFDHVALLAATAKGWEVLHADEK